MTATVAQLVRTAFDYTATHDLDRRWLLAAAQTVLACGRHGHTGNALIAAAMLRGWLQRNPP